MKAKLKKDRYSDGRVLFVESDKNDTLNYADAERIRRGDLQVFLPLSYEKGRKTFKLSYQINKAFSLSELLKEPLEPTQLKSLLFSLLNMVRQCEANRLSRRKVMFEDSCVFFEPTFQTLRFAYVPLNSYTAPFGETEMLAHICESAQIPIAESGLASATLDYARRTAVLTSVAFEDFLQDQGLLEPDEAPSFKFEPSEATNELDARSAYGWDFVSESFAPQRIAPRQDTGPTLVRESDGATVVLENGLYTMGRSNSCSIALPENDSLSREHAQLLVKEGVYIIRDLNSTNGVFVNGKRIEPGADVSLNKGDRFALARERFFLT